MVGSLIIYTLEFRVQSSEFRVLC